MDRKRKHCFIHFNLASGAYLVAEEQHNQTDQPINHSERKDWEIEGHGRNGGQNLDINIRKWEPSLEEGRLSLLLREREPFPPINKPQHIVPQKVGHDELGVEEDQGDDWHEGFEHKKRVQLLSESSDSKEVEHC